MDRQHNDQRIHIIHDTHKTQDWATKTTLKTGVNSSDPYVHDHDSPIKHLGLKIPVYFLHHARQLHHARVPLMEQELPTLPGHLSSPPVFSGVRVTRSLILYVCFVDRCLSFCTFSFDHCVVDIRILITSLWYLQTLLKSVVLLLWKESFKQW
jgi:hypothetical protein